jgi:hypothetical protein
MLMMHYSLFDRTALVSEFLLAGIISSLECAEVSVAIVHGDDYSISEVDALPISNYVRAQYSMIEFKLFRVKSTLA